MRTRLVLGGYGLVLGLLVASNVAAQEPAADDSAGAAPASATSDLDDGEELNQKTDAEDELSGPDAEAKEPVVNPEDQKSQDATQYTIGARYRFIVVPNFLINAFGIDGGRDIIVHGVGAEFGMAKSNFEIIFSPWYAGYGMAETPFKGPSDPQNAWELVTSDLHQIYLTADLLWRKNIVQDLDFTVGVSGGIGIVFGSLTRWEAINPNFPGAPALTDDPNVPGRLTRCPGPNQGPNGQCAADGNYGTGEAWPVYPWLSGQVGLRWNPHENFVGRFDLGASSTGFWLGIGADYGL